MSDRLVFFSKSKAAPPGQGVHEEVHDANAYAALPQLHPDWRRRLSHFDDSVEFTFRGGPWQTEGDAPRWRTLEHVWQALKLAEADRAVAWRFTVNSGHVVGQGSGLQAQSKRKWVCLSEAQLEQAEASRDGVQDPLTGRLRGGWLEEATLAKFWASWQAAPGSVARVPAEVLLATGQSELWHLAMQRSKPSQLIRFVHLEQVRERLRNDIRG